MTPQPHRPEPTPWWRQVPWALLVLVGLFWGASQWWHRHDRAEQFEAIRQASPEGRIKLYTSATCIFCDQAKAWLNEAHVPFQECRVDEPGSCAEAYAGMGAPGTPVVQVDADKLQLGFDPGWLAQALRQPPRR